jgi:hypothetical protein
MTQDAFEAWCKADFPECDLTRLPSGNYRIKSTQDKYEGFLAGQCSVLRAVGWMRIDGTFHRVCPPLDEPSGWKPLFEEIA